MAQIQECGRDDLPATASQLTSDPDRSGDVMMQCTIVCVNATITPFSSGRGHRQRQRRRSRTVGVPLAQSLLQHLLELPHLRLETLQLLPHPLLHTWLLTSLATPFLQSPPPLARALDMPEQWRLIRSSFMQAAAAAPRSSSVWRRQ